MSQKLTDLNTHLFNQLERLSNATADQIDQEVARTDAIVAVSEQIVHATDLTLKAAKLVAEHGGYVSRLMPATEAIVGVAQGSPPPSPAIEAKPQ